MRLPRSKRLNDQRHQSTVMKFILLLMGAALILNSLNLGLEPKPTTTNISTINIAARNDEDPSTSRVSSQEPDYIGPCEMASDVERGLLYVAQVDTPAIAVIDVETDQITRRIDLPSAPTGLCLSPTGTRLYVTCEGPLVENEEVGEMRQDPQGVVRVIDTATGETSDMIRVGCGARGPCISPDGTTLYVCNRFDNDLAVIDFETKQEIRRIQCVREPFDAVVTSDGHKVFVANRLPVHAREWYDIAAELTIINTDTWKTNSIRYFNGSTCMGNLCVSPDGKYLYAVGICSFYSAHAYKRITNILLIINIEKEELLTSILLDLPDPERADDSWYYQNVALGTSDPYDVVASEDGSKLYVTLAGITDLIIIDAAAMHAKLDALPKTDEELWAIREASGDTEHDPDDYLGNLTLDDVPYDLEFLDGMRIHGYLPGKGTRGAAVFDDDVYVALYFEDAIAHFEWRIPNFKRPILTSEIELGPEPVLSEARRGELLFQDATIAHKQYCSCATCHPDGRVDGLNHDLMDDGLGTFKDTSSLLLAHESEPNGWQGIRPTAEINVAAKVRHLLFAVRPEEDIQVIMAYIRSLEPAPSPHYRYDEDGRPLTSVAAGRALFESEEVGCATCHPAPIYTDNQSHDVGSRSQYDRVDEFYTPSLVECWRTGPYLHDGRYLTIRELLIDGNHGNAADVLSEEEFEQLALYVLTR
jgi:YVTN family beta-propeller protein